jgi:hypothetical protein
VGDRRREGQRTGRLCHAWCMLMGSVGRELRLTGDAFSARKSILRGGSRMITHFLGKAVAQPVGAGAGERNWSNSTGPMELELDQIVLERGIGPIPFPTQKHSECSAHCIQSVFAWDVEDEVENDAEVLAFVEVEPRMRWPQRVRWPQREQ